MNQNPTQFDQNPGDTQHFLRPKQAKPDEKTPVRHLERQRDIKDVARMFPKALLDKTFRDQVEKMLKPVSVFVSMVVQIDPSSATAGSKTEGPKAESVHAVADAIQKMCDENQGIWGIINAQVFGCCFADCQLADGHRIAEQLKQHLSSVKAQATVTIGIAGYPSLKYAKHHIMDNAYKALEHAKYLGPDTTVALDAVSLNISGDTYFEGGDIDGAIKEFKNALLLDSANENVHNSLGVCYGELGDYKNALEEFEATMQLKPSETFAMYNAGLAHKLLGNHQKALSYFLKSLEQDADLYEAAFQAGRLYQELNLPEKGIEYLQKAIRLNPDSNFAFGYLGECYAAMEMNKQAISAFKKAIKKNAGDTVALSGLGWLYHCLGQNAEIALLFCKQSVEIDPNNGLHRFRLGQLLAKEGQIDEALTEYRKAKQLGYDSTATIEKIRQLQHNPDHEKIDIKADTQGVNN